MQIIRDPAALLDYHGCAFVPTMGALHAGHLELIRRASTIHTPVLVSVFVNPTQFGESADFERYPRTIDADVALAEQAGAAAVFAPQEAVIYPPGLVLDAPSLPAVATEPDLEDRFRPGHFRGVCNVVARMFDLIQPRCAIFGEKDYQQLLVIETMVEREQPRWGDLAIIRHPTVRHVNGLALSSRNRLLSDSEREQARGLSLALNKAQEAEHPNTAEGILAETLAAHDLEVEYAVVRDAATLMPVESLENVTRALIAARLGSVRLIDNRAMPVRA